MSHGAQRPNTFRRRQRLISKAAYAYVFQAPERIADRNFTVLARPNTVGFARLGLAISKKSAPRAVDRNRLKRRVRESFRLTADELPAVDIVVMARPGAAGHDNAHLQRSLDALWKTLTRRCQDRASSHG